MDKKPLRDSYESDESNNESKRKLNKILAKKPKVGIKFNHQAIKLNYKAYAKICKLAQVYRVESIQLSIFPKDLEEKNAKSKKGADKEKEGKKDGNKEEKIRITNKFKPDVLESVGKKGSCISKGASGVQCMMKFLYSLLIILGTCIFGFLSFHIYRDYLTLRQGELITICFSSLSLLCGGLGLAKLCKRSKVQFDKVNTFLILLIVNACFFIGMKFCIRLAGETIYQFCSDYFIVMIIFTAVAIILALTLICMNVCLVSFYEKYYKEEKDKRLLGSDEYINVNDQAIEMTEKLDK